MITISEATGQVGGKMPRIEEEHGDKGRMVARPPTSSAPSWTEKQRQWRVTSAIRNFWSRPCEGAEAVFTLIPPDPGVEISWLCDA